MAQLPKKQTDSKSGEGMLRWNLEMEGWESWTLLVVVLLSVSWKCLQSDGLKTWPVAFSSKPRWNLWTASHRISLFWHTTGGFSSKASPAQAGRRIKKCHASVQDRRPKSHVEMEDFKHRRASASLSPLGRGTAFPWEGSGEGCAGGGAVLGWMLSNRAGRCVAARGQLCTKSQQHH